jgi:hypothetical protein
VVIIRQKSDRRGKTLVVLLAVFVALAIAVVLMWRKAPTEPSVDEGRSVAEAFLEQIRAGHAQQAWESTTAEFKSAEGRESFVRSVKKHPALAKPLSFVSVQTATVQGNPRAEYIYRAADGGGTVRLLAGNDRGSWRIDRMIVE